MRRKSRRISDACLPASILLGLTRVVKEKDAASPTPSRQATGLMQHHHLRNRIQRRPSFFAGLAGLKGACVALLQQSPSACYSPLDLKFQLAGTEGPFAFRKP